MGARPLLAKAPIEGTGGAARILALLTRFFAFSMRFPVCRPNSAKEERELAKTVREVMTKTPISMSADTSVTQAAKAMSDRHVGSVVVMVKDKPLGIVTDRDIAVRAVARRSDLSNTRLADICSMEIAAGRPDQSVDDAIKVMKSHDVKRVLVIDNSKLEGIVSLGDLTAHAHGDELQLDLSRARPNN